MYLKADYTSREISQFTAGIPWRIRITGFYYCTQAVNYLGFVLIKCYVPVGTINSISITVLCESPEILTESNEEFF